MNCSVRTDTAEARKIEKPGSVVEDYTFFENSAEPRDEDRFLTDQDRRAAAHPRKVFCREIPLPRRVFINESRIQLEDKLGLAELVDQSQFRDTVQIQRIPGYLLTAGIRETGCQNRVSHRQCSRRPPGWSKDEVPVRLQGRDDGRRDGRGSHVKGLPTQPRRARGDCYPHVAREAVGTTRDRCERGLEHVARGDQELTLGELNGNAGAEPGPESKWNRVAKVFPVHLPNPGGCYWHAR